MILLSRKLLSQYCLDCHPSHLAAKRLIEGNDAEIPQDVNLKATLEVFTTIVIHLYPRALRALNILHTLLSPVFMENFPKMVPFEASMHRMNSSSIGHSLFLLTEVQPLALAKAAHLAKRKQL